MQLLMGFLKKFLYKKEDGHALVLASMVFTGLVGITGLVIDGGMLYMQQTHLQKTANAAVLSGAQELMAPNDKKAKSVVDDILRSHGETDSFYDLHVAMGDRLSIRLEKPVPLTFASLFGVEEVNVQASAIARVGVMGNAVGAAPLGIEESVELEYGVEYKLRVDETEVDTGNFGVLALEGPGARTYKDNLLYGYQEAISVGDVLNTQTGNIAGPTREAVNELVNSCSDMNQRDCRRILLVPVYKPYNHDQNQLKQVKVTGFAYFYISEPMSRNDTVVRGVFIERTGTGFESELAKERGAFVVRLTE
ncbi:pilus assembly protein TadG-related protein [Bacillus shivajii]|uniref:pilus assembly protein TadG-related protein n=1 Tax=Bacillus shivajii TaxID=1983719 RepID=UPI001CF92FDC|nr:pilus assembly protein TadG-related protein [Bacillus shivajii]UCZ53144.1 pilus assembly protein TadG-related protein [Bacillus shivajii]